jgi:hypothetical protein
MIICDGPNDNSVDDNAIIIIVEISNSNALYAHKITPTGDIIPKKWKNGETRKICRPGNTVETYES